MTPELLTSIFAVILSLCASYLPGFSTWYAALETIPKRQVMAGGLALIALVIFGLGCAGLGTQIGVSLTCDLAGAWIILRAFFAAVAINQATYQLTKNSNPARVESPI
jgi:hypothetical protein